MAAGDDPVERVDDLQPRVEAAAGGAPYTALTTIDDVYPERPDRG